jgi:hypothetical protein
MDRHADLGRLYAVLASLEGRLGGKRTLAECDGRMGWPVRGVYFFFEPGEARSDTGIGPRVVRVGTQALQAGSSTSLWRRLSQHRGITATCGGNHRGSIFRFLVGNAIKSRDAHVDPYHGVLGTTLARLRDYCACRGNRCSLWNARWKRPSANTSANCRSCGSQLTIRLVGRVIVGLLIVMPLPC